MSIDAFSNFIQKPQSAVSTPKVAPQAQQAAVVQTPVVTAAPQVVSEPNNKSGLKEIVKQAVPIVVPLASIPLAVILANKTASTKATEAVKDTMEDVADIASRAAKEAVKEVQEDLVRIVGVNKAEITEVAQKGLDSNNKVVKNILAGMVGAAAALGFTNITDKSNENEIIEAFKSGLSQQKNNAETALNQSNIALSSANNILPMKYFKEFSGLQLATVSDSKTVNNAKYLKAIEQIQNAGTKYLTGTDNHITPIDKKHPTIWSVTSEFAPIKEGGLGVVPVDVQNNANVLGVDMPTILPLYQVKGMSSLKEVQGKYEYKYGNKVFDLEKIASFKTNSHQAGKTTEEEVEVFVHYLGEKPKITQKQQKVYEELLKADSEAAALYIEAPALYDEQIAAKKGESSVAEIIKDKAVIEEVTSSPKFKTYKKLVFIKNNKYFDGTMYSHGKYTEEPEKFAFFSKAVYDFMKAKEDPSSVKDLKINNKMAYDLLKSPDSLILNDWQASSIAALSRYKAPMENAHGGLSESAKEKLANMNIITIGHNVKHQGHTWENNNFDQKKQATTNILNTLFDEYTYDIVSNAKSGISEASPDIENAKDLDNILLLKSDRAYDNCTNLLNMGISLSDYFCPVSENYADELTRDGQRFKDLSYDLQPTIIQKKRAGKLKGVINGNDFDVISLKNKIGNVKSATGIQDYLTYEDEKGNWTIDAVLDARAKNKVNFYQNYLIPFSLQKDDTEEAHSEKAEMIRNLTTKNSDPARNLELTNGNVNTSTVLPRLTAEQLEQTPVLSTVGRFVNQKGIDILCDAIKILFDNWETDFPGKEKPIFTLAGADGEDGSVKQGVINFKDSLKPEDSNRVVFAHGWAPMQAITASSDFFLMPSRFEPCGLTQGESFALATPVIASAVGGIVDTVNRRGEGKENGVLTDINKELTAEEFYKAMKEGLKIWFEDKEKYASMVENSYAENFSWIQPDKKGPVYDYLEMIGVDKNSLPDVKDIKK